jgi:hypothetical protein
MIEASFLSELAALVERRVDKVVLNGVYQITDFAVKSVSSNVLALNYIVPVARVPLVTLIELRSSDDTVLMRNVVNLPITADHMMLQTITVKEAS